MTVKPKHRRARGSGSVYRQGQTWWIKLPRPGRPPRRGEHRLPQEGRRGSAVASAHGSHGAQPAHRQACRAADVQRRRSAVVDDCTINNKVSLVTVERRIVKHLTPIFGGRRLVGIKTADVSAYIAHRQQQGIVNKNAVRVSDVSNAEINRELQTFKRIFSLAIENDLIAMKPQIPMLEETAARTGSSSPSSIDARPWRTCPAEIQPVITFAYITGWRIASEVLPLEWRQVDFAAGEVRLDAGTTKNREGRVFPMTTDLRTLLQAQHAEHERLKKAGHIVPWVFWRMVAEDAAARRNRSRSSLQQGVEGRRVARPAVPVASRTTCGGRPSGTWCGRASPSASRCS